MASSVSGTRFSTRLALKATGRYNNAKKRKTNKRPLSEEEKLNERFQMALDAELDSTEINKLFEVIFEVDTGAVTEFLSRERYLFKLPQRYLPYSVHQRLYIQQQTEQERRRSSLTITGYRSIATISRINFDTKAYLDRVIHNKVFRTKVVRNIISFIDNHSNRMLATRDDSGDCCIICMCNYQPEQLLRKLHCSHRFHRKCIDEWLVKSYFCPVCRTNLTGIGRINRGLALLYNIWKQEKIDLNNAAAAAAAATAAANSANPGQSTSSQSGSSSQKNEETDDEADEDEEDDDDTSETSSSDEDYDDQRRDHGIGPILSYTRSAGSIFVRKDF